ncbi:MAG: TraB/GumN family protein [Chitinivibrionia bacterium]|nr:TraB/GumN family protein [Chitinivibrionia bacterium]
MKRRTLLICGVSMCVLALVLSAFAQPGTTVATTSLWRISSAKNSVHVLGSIHLLTADDYPLDSRMEKAFDEADIVVFETDLDSVQSSAIQRLILSNAVYEKGKTLKSELSDSMYALAFKQFQDIGLDLNQFDSIKPWFAALTLAVTELQKMGFDFERGVDKYFFEKAAAQQKPVGALETASYQAKLFISMSDAEQERFLFQTLDQMDDIEQYMKAIVTAWKKGDCDELNATLNKSFEDYPDLQRKFLVQRNENWLPQVEAYLKDGKKCLFIVGEAHLCGENGLLEMLARKGYAVEQR